MKWLNTQQDQSVIYVSFGSIASPTSEEICRICEALLALNTPFIWSIKAHHWTHLPSTIQEKIGKPESPFLIVPWAPQKIVLSHPAIKVFLSHCGWNSTVESLAAGVPVVGWPMFADQLMNAELLDKEGVGKLIPGTGVAGARVIPAGEIASVLKTVMIKENGYLETAKKWSLKIRNGPETDGIANREFSEFAKYL